MEVLPIAMHSVIGVSVETIFTIKTTSEQRANILFLHQEEISMREIAKRVKCLRNGVSGVIKRFRETGSTDDKLRSGRLRKKALVERIDPWCGYLYYTVESQALSSPKSGEILMPLKYTHRRLEDDSLRQV